MAVLDTVKAEIEDLTGLVSREASYDIKVLNCTTLIEKIAEMKKASTPLPEECRFESYDEWVAGRKGFKISSKLISKCSKSKRAISGT